MKKISIYIINLIACLIPNYAYLPAQPPIEDDKAVGVELFISLFSKNSTSHQQYVLERISETWNPTYSVLAVESLYLIGDVILSVELQNILQEKTGKNFRRDLSKWYDWLWNQDQNISDNYQDFKAHIYKRIDPKFEKYFKDRQASAQIRLDEVRWGGVKQDGIPPLRYPNMIPANKASFMEDGNIVFGIEIDGDVRAYPKRILAWHEMFVDQVGGVRVAGVYCTLCGTVILYKTEHQGVQYDLGTSGFLYRSNKLMYDIATQSLWNTLQGRPVIGPLVDQDIELDFLSVVTTTWGEWKRKHPDTQVLSLRTGYRRDYREGIAYKDYFATDQLMFTTPFKDRRLKNKQEILALRLPDFPTDQLAISTKFLNKHPIYIDKLGNQTVLILTDKTGGNRVFDPEELHFASYDQDQTLTDAQGGKWTVHENTLISSEGRILKSIPAHRAFWFGWLAAYPDTRLVK